MGAGKYFYGMIGLGGFVLLGSQLDKPESPVAKVMPAAENSISSPVVPVSNGLGGITLERGGDNHFYVDALVNGARVRFMVDTGASSVVLTSADAQRVGIGTGNYDAKGIGAGGEVKLMPVTLTRLAVGPLFADSVPAMVAEKGSLPVSLLGQSFLARLDSVTIRNNQMVLR